MFIYSYQLTLQNEQTVYMHEGAELLGVRVPAGSGVALLYALVDPSKMQAARLIAVRLTGERFDETAPFKYIGTFQLRPGGLVYHAFEVFK